MSSPLARFIAIDTELDALLDATAARCTLQQERKLARLTRDHADAFNALSLDEIASLPADASLLDSHYC